MHLSQFSRRSSYVFAILLSLIVIQCFSIVALAGTKALTVRFNQNDIQYSKQKGYDVVSLPDFDFIRDSAKVGEPMMLVKTIRVLIPSGTEVTNIRIVSTKGKILEGKYYIYPIQYPLVTGQSDEKKFVTPKKEIYESSDNYPRKLVELQSESYFRDYHIAEIQIYPLQYNPVQRELTLNTEISFEIEYSVSSKYQLIPRLRQNERKQNEIKEKLRQIIINPEDILSDNTTKNGLSKSAQSVKTVTQQLFISSQPSAIDGQDVEYIIITNDDLVSSFQRLADWKTKKGVVSTIKTVSWISENYSGCDTQEKIRHFIQDAYLKWGTEYILLGGDVDIIPGRVNEGQAMHPLTDLYYSAIYPTTDNWNADGDNLFGEIYPQQPNGDDRDDADYGVDIFVGRAPVHNSTEANLFIDKVLTYERSSLAPSLPTTTYLTKMLSLGGVVYTGSWDWYCGIYAKEQVRTLPIPASMTNWKMYEHESTFDGYYTYDEQLTRVNAINKMNAGYGIINHIDHSNPYVMQMGRVTHGGDLTTADVDNLTNGNQYSVVYSAGCSPGAFDYDCIGEHFVMKNNGGAVAFVGPSRSVYTWDGDNHDKKFFESLFNNGNYNAGQTLALAIYNNYTSNIYNLLGDPEMPIWTAAPQTLSVTHPTSVQNGTNNFTVTINNLPSGKNALICLKKGVEDYAAITVTGTGSPVNANFVFTPNTPGTLNVTVTAHNFIPYEGSATVTQTSSANLYMDSYTIDDDAVGESVGNGDGIIDAGETIEMPITVRNSGMSFAEEVYATLAAYVKGTTTANPYITITDASKYFDKINSGISRTCEDDFGFTVSKDCPKEEIIEFKLTITDIDNNTWVETFYLQVGAPQIQHIAHTVTGNLIANATVSLAIQLSNYGTSVAKGISATLTSSSSYVSSITGSPQSFGDISPNSNASRNYNFAISASYPSGNEQLLTFVLTIQDAYGKVWTHNFDLKKPNIPTSLQFTAYETAIDLVWTKPSDSDLKGYNIYRSASSGGTYTKVNNRLVEGTSYFKDVGLQKETMYYYKIAAVDLSSNESNQTNYIETSTTIKYVSGWPIRAGNIVFASPTLFDVDNDGDMEIFIAEELDKVYGWDKIGLELFDIDGNTTTLSGFADETGANFWSSPAIGDLEGDGINELIIQGRGNYILYCWHINDGNSDGRPDLSWSVNLGQPCVGSPTIGDIDGDGKSEIIIITEDGNVHIKKFDGTIFQTEPWKNITGSVGAYCTPAIADLDGNGDLEIIFGGRDGKVYVCNHDGSNFSANWPFNTGRNNLSAAPAVADIDRDGEYEIIFVAYDWISDSPENCICYVLNENGTHKTGWGSGVLINDPANVVPASPAVGNLDGDSQLEIVVATGSTIYVWNHDGTALSGWPKTGFTGAISSPMIANIDDIAGAEIVTGSDDHNLYAWHADGTNVKGWPLRTGNRIQSSPAIGDIDGDGQNEVVVGSDDYWVYIWDTKGTVNRDWAMFHHDARHTGSYEQIVSGTITQNATWDGEITVRGNTTIASGVTLNIRPRSVIKFASGTSLTVNGRLLANGTPSQMISFTSSVTGGTWSGIILSGSGANNSQLTYASISNVLTYGGAALIVNGASGATINHCTISNNVNYGTTGISLINAGSPNISYNTISNNGSYGIRYQNTSGDVWKNTLQNNPSGGISLYNASPNFGHGGFPAYYGNNVITGGSYGIYADYYSYPYVGSQYNSYYGYNSIYDNSTKRVRASLSDILAEQNWWGSSSPPSSWFEAVNNSIIEYYPWLYSPAGQQAAPLTETGDITASNTVNQNESNSKIDSCWVAREAFLSSEPERSAEILFSILKSSNDVGVVDRAFSEFVILAQSVPENKKVQDLFPALKNKTYQSNAAKINLARLFELSGDRTQALQWFQNAKGQDSKKDEFKLASLGEFYNNLLHDATKAEQNLSDLKKYLVKDSEVEEAVWLFGVLKNSPSNDGGKGNLPTVNSEVVLESRLENYPNPFNPTTTIAYSIPEAGHVSLVVYDYLGREVRRLVEGIKNEGRYQVLFDASNLASGVYFYRLQTGHRIMIKKMLVLK